MYRNEDFDTYPCLFWFKNILPRAGYTKFEILSN